MRIKSIIRLTVFSLMMLLLVFGCVSSPKKTEQAKQTEVVNWKYHAIVGVDFVNQHVQVPPRDDVMIIDARPKRAKYDKGHIPGAVSIPDSQFKKMTDKLPKDKNTLLVFYCGGLKCKLSHKSAFKAEKLGYTNIKVFATGFPSWMKVKGHYAEVSVDYVKKQVDKQADMVLVDSRPKRKKYDKGHIPGAVSIPDSQFKKMTDRLPEDKAKQLVFYCGGYKCKLSHKSAAKAIAIGYTDVKVFSAGFPAWKKVAGAGGTAKPMASSIRSGKEEGSIDIAAFEKIIKKNPASIMLIDVRDPDEFKAGAFKSAVNLPVDDLEKKIATLPIDKPIVFVCATGARSGESFYMVKDMRPEIKDVYYLEAEIDYKKDGSYTIKANQ